MGDANPRSGHGLDATILAKRTVVGYSSHKASQALAPLNTGGPAGTSGDISTQRQGARLDAEPDYLACCVFCYLNIDEQTWKEVTSGLLRGVWEAFSAVLDAEAAAKTYDEYHRYTNKRNLVEWSSDVLAFLALGDFSFKYFEIVVSEPKELYVIDVTINVDSGKIDLSRGVVGDKWPRKVEIPEDLLSRIRPTVKKLVKPLSKVRERIRSKLLKKAGNEVALKLAHQVVRRVLFVVDAAFLVGCASKCAIAKAEAKLDFKLRQFQEAFSSALEDVWDFVCSVARSVMLPLVVAKMSLDNDNLKFREGLPAVVKSRFNGLLVFLWLTRNDPRAATLVELIGKPIADLNGGRGIVDDVVDGVALFYDLDNGSLGPSATNPLPGTRRDVLEKVNGLSTLQLVRYLDFTGVLYFKQDPESLASATFPQPSRRKE